MSYSLKEIIDIAIGMEEAGNHYYDLCASRFDDPAMKKIFTHLAAQELEHRNYFQTLRASAPDSSGNFTDEYYAYLRAIGGTRVFHREPVDTVLSLIDTPVKAIRKGFQDEKESILFYSELRAAYRDDPKVVPALETIIEEERRHVMALMELMEKQK